MTHFSSAIAAQLAQLARQVLPPGGLLLARSLVRSWQTRLDYPTYRRWRRLAEQLPLAPLRARHPEFVRKYLAGYVARSWSRTERLAALSNHYHFLTAVAGPDFFARVAGRPLLWQAPLGDEVAHVTLSYPVWYGFESELSLNFEWQGEVLQVVSFVVVPGAVVGLPAGPALLLSQVQGAPQQPQRLKQATRALHDITPAALLVNVAYGLAAGLGIGQAAGITAAEQMSRGPKCHFDYDAFWVQFGGRREADPRFFALRIPAPEKDIRLVPQNNRGRTLRKRAFKQQVRAAVANWVRENLAEKAEKTGR